MALVKKSVMCQYRKINKRVTIMTTSPHFLRKNGNLKTVALITLWDSTLQERHITTPLHCSKIVNASPQKGYISDQLTDEAIGVVDRAKTLDQPFMLYTGL